MVEYKKCGKREANKREGAIESLLVKKVKQVGGLCFKFVSGVKGVPDRIVICNGKVGFIELKRPKGGMVSEHQKYWIEKIRESGAYADVILNQEQVEDFMRWIDD